MGKKRLISLLAIHVFTVYVNNVFGAKDISNDFNLLTGGDFPPVILDSIKTGAKGWLIMDRGRFAHNKDPKEPEFLRGDKCFKLDFFLGGMSIRFAKDLYSLSKHYLNTQFCIGPDLVRLAPPAPIYHLNGEINSNKLPITILSKDFVPDDKWMKIDISLDTNLEDNLIKLISIRFISFKPVPGGKFAFRNFRLSPKYPNARKFITLPNGGKLSKIIIPKNATWDIVQNAFLWRGWLWRLSGAALAVEETVNPIHEPGALVIRQGNTTPGGFKLKIDSQGGMLEFSRPYAIRTALFEYLRIIGCRFFAHDNQIVPASNSKLILKPYDREVKPKFNYVDSNGNAPPAFTTLTNGGITRREYTTGQTGNWYEISHRKNEHTARYQLPYGLYGKTHPEYYALKKDGKRRSGKDVSRLHLCTSNSEVRKKVAALVKDWIRSQPNCYNVDVSDGDGLDVCFCSECSKIDPNLNDESRTDVYLAFLNSIAREVAKEFPNKTFECYAYTQLYGTPPLHVKPEKNVVIKYCPWNNEFRCPAHLDCNFNREGIENVKKWSKLLGKEHLGFQLYPELPYYYIRKADFFNKYGYHHIHLNAPSDLLAYLINRWNLGDNIESAMTEACAAYYGKGGEAMHKAFKVLDEYGCAYKHKPNDKNANNGSQGKYFEMLTFVPSRKTIIDRKTFDKVYTLYNKALAAANGNLDATRRILYEKLMVMRTDISTHNRGTCTGKKELAAFSLRVADFIKTVSEMLDIAGNQYPYNLFKIKIGYSSLVRDYFMAYTGIDIGKTYFQNWTESPEIQKFLKDPVAAMSFGPEKIPGGWRWQPIAMLGGCGVKRYAYQCPPRVTNFIRRISSKQNVITLELTLDRELSFSTILGLEGQDDEKSGRALLEVRANGKKIFSGKNNFTEKKWSSMAFNIPGGTLKKGNNKIEIINITPDRNAGKVVATYANDTYIGDERQQNYHWGWIAISGATLYDINNEFKAFANGKPSTWRITDFIKPSPTVEVKDRIIKIISQGAKQSGIYCFSYRDLLKYGIKVPSGTQIRLCCRLSGSGTAIIGGWYCILGPDSSLLKKSPKNAFLRQELTEESKDYETVLTIQNNSIFRPALMVDTNGHMNIEKVSYEVVK